MKEVWFEAEDADNEPTIWRQQEGELPKAALRKCDIAHQYRDALWNLITRTLP